MSYMSCIQASPAELARQEALVAISPPGPFEMTPVIHPQSGIPDPRAKTFWSATANALYIVRADGEDIFGKLAFAGKLAECPDLVVHGRRGPIGCDADGLVGLDLWRAADRAARIDRPSQPVAFHAIGWLPEKGEAASWKELVLEFLDTQIVANGMVADWAIHALADGQGGWVKRPHVHLVVTARFWRKDRRQGEPQAAWFPTAKRRASVGQVWEEMAATAAK